MSIIIPFAAIAAIATTPASAPADSVSTDLDELVVVAEKPVIAVKEGAIHYNVEEDPSAAGSSLLDMLRKVPNVTVDAEKNITIGGSSDFKITVNGMEMPGLKQNASAIFDAMPASAVVRLEVITEPGVKYDAEGASAVLNIVTEKKQTKDGYNANLTMSLGRMNNSLSGYARMKKKNVTGSINATYGTNCPFASPIDTYALNDYFTSLDEDPYLSTISSYRQKAKYHFIMAGMNFGFQPNKDNLFTINVDFTKTLPSLTATERFSSVVPSMAPQNYTRLVDARIGFSNLSSGASYQHNFSNDHHIVAAYLFNYGNTNMTLDSEYLFDYTTDASPYASDGTASHNREHTFQIDYTLPFARLHTLDLGAKAIIRHNNASGNSFAGATETDMQPVAEMNTDMIQKQTIEAVYAAYTLNVSDLSLNAGVRYEHSASSLRNRLNPDEDFSKPMNDVVPSATLSWNFSPMESIRLNYSGSIRRPTITDLNPYAGVEIGGIISAGNPDLKSQKNHKVALTYSNFGSILGVSATLEYTRANDLITNVIMLRDGDFISTSANIGHNDRPALTLIFNYNITRGMRFSLTGGVNYSYLKGAETSNRGWEGNFTANWNYSLPSGYTFNAYGGWNSRKLMLQGTSGAFYFYGISASKSLLADKSLTLSLSASNFLQNSQKFSTAMTSANNRFIRDIDLHSWNIGVSLSWNFGSLSSVRDLKTASGIVNDDVEQSSPSTNL